MTATHDRRILHDRILHDRILHALRRLSPDGVVGPTIYEWRAARKVDKAAHSCEEIIREIFGGWRQALSAAGLVQRSTRRKGDAAKHRSQEQVDLLLAEEFPGWQPGPASSHYLRALLLSEGLPVAKAVEEVQIEIYDAQGRPLLTQGQDYFNPAHYPQSFTVHIHRQQRYCLR